MGIRLLVERVAIVAPGSVYDAYFRYGVNIISGPISTGKSSVLALIDYALGASNRPTYPEIAKCSDVLVQFLVGKEHLTVQRSLHSTNRKARIYEGHIDDVFAARVEGEEVSAAHDPAEKSVSKELLRRLGLDNIKVKTAPTQSASDVSTFSLRDLMHFIYVDQDRIDSQRAAFFEQHFAIAIKWRAAFEVVTGLYDEVSAALSSSLKDAHTDVAQHRQYLENVRLFLTRAKVARLDQLREELADASKERADLDERVTGARSATQMRKGEHLELARRRNDLSHQRDESLAKEDELARSLKQLSRLRVQYERERAQLEFLRESESLVGSLPVTRCPSCLQPTPRPGDTSDAHDCHVCRRVIPESTAGVDVDRRLSALKRRAGDLEAYINDLSDLQSDLGKRRVRLEQQLEGVDAAIRRLQPAAIFPEMQELMQLQAAIGIVESRTRQLHEHVALRERAEAEATTIAGIEARATEIARELEERQTNRPSRDDVVNALSAHFNDVLHDIRFPNLQGARIDSRTYVPVVREQLYGELFSRGAIALAVASWHLAALRYCLDSHNLFPMLFMIDSPLSNVGHDEADAEFRDQQIVDAFYGVLMHLHRTRGPEFQLIVCDNRPPAAARGLVVLQFTGDPTTGRVGLIADEPAAAADVSQPEAELNKWTDDLGSATPAEDES
jgi:hypothetical protein